MTGLLNNEPQRKENEDERFELLEPISRKAAISLLKFRRNMFHPSSGYPEYTLSHSGTL
jgi:hypothetical protein